VRTLAEWGEVRGVVRGGLAPGAAETIRIPDIAGEVDWAPHLVDVDAVLHLAARVHIPDDPSDAAYRRTNVGGTVRLAEAAIAAGVKRFVFVSTVKVHGERTTVEPFNSTSPFRPADPYGRSKAEAEDALRTLQDRDGLDLVVVRPPLVYGPDVRANFLRLLRTIDRGTPLPLGRVENRRSLVFVDNLADLLARVATSDAASGEAFMVADGDPVSTPTLVRALAHALGRPARLMPVPLSMLRMVGRLLGQAEAVDRLVGSLEVDSSRTQSVLDWSPPFSFDEGVAATAAWFAEGERR
jgi:nucleoside-diphosphate-sugar epimerase